MSILSIPSDPHAAFLLGLMLAGLPIALLMLIWPPRLYPPKLPDPTKLPMPPLPRMDDPELMRLARERVRHARRRSSQ